MNKNTVEIKFIEFRKQHYFTNTIDHYIQYLAKLGYTDRAILLHTMPILHDLILKNGGNNE